jgi:Protein of unknown function (DUF2804)
MRSLEAPPSSVLDPLTHAPARGSFRGGLPPSVDLGALAVPSLPILGGSLFRVAHEKRWVYAAISAGDVFLGAAIIKLGYASSAFVFAFDRASGRMLADVSLLGPSFFAKVNGSPREGASARFSSPLPRASLSWRRAPGEGAFSLAVRAGEVSLDARFAVEGAPPPIGVIADLGAAGLVNTTEKGALLAVTGAATIGGRRISLDGGLGGYDYTHGYLARHTAWQWAFLLGRAESGERVGLNLVQGFVGEPECALWIDGALYPLAEGRFTFDAKRPGEPWQVRTADESVDLRFEPGGIHQEHKDLGVVTSRFIQPVGCFSGSIRVPGRAPLVLARALGVVEDQDVLW